MDELREVQIENMEKIIAAKGVCVGIHCNDCPFVDATKCFDRQGFSRVAELKKLKAGEPVDWITND